METSKRKFEIGERVLVSPQVTNQNNWIEATIIELQNNPFVGMVITVETDKGICFFEKPDMFKKTSELCLQ